MRPNFTLMVTLAAAFVLPIGAQTGDQHIEGPLRRGVPDGRGT